MAYEFHEDMTEDEARFVRSGLVEFANRFTEPRDYEEFGIVLRDAEGKPHGGILGNTMWSWLRIDVLWLPDELRGRGLGHELLQRAEALARRRGCTSAMLNTFEFEARDFYEGHGYTVHSQLDGFPAGHTQLQMIKRTLARPVGD